jgi:hypothetical protein
MQSTAGRDFRQIQDMEIGARVSEVCAVFLGRWVGLGGGDPIYIIASDVFARADSIGEGGGGVGIGVFESLQTWLFIVVRDRWIPHLG